MSLSKKTRKQSRRKTAQGTTMIDEVYALAKKLGWKCVNKDEDRLIELLRHTTHDGRDDVYKFAGLMQKAAPWRDAASQN